ncbi:MAG: hypothetical protein AAF720_15245 [Pseudomonadota bacterium]
MLSADNWCVKVHDKVYGPYSAEQLKKFASEGRLAAWSKIAPAGGNNWRSAINEPVFASLFSTESPKSHAQTIAETRFGKRAETTDHDFENTAPAPVGKPTAARQGAQQRGPASSSNRAASEPKRAQPLGKNSKTAPRNAPRPSLRRNQSLAQEDANFVLIFDVVSAAASRVEPAIASLGPHFRLADNVWTVNCRLTAIGVRNAVAPFLRPNESLFVSESAIGKTTWQNYAPAVHAKISDMYFPTRKEQSA